MGNLVTKGKATRDYVAEKMILTVTIR